MHTTYTVKVKPIISFVTWKVSIIKMPVRDTILLLRDLSQYKVEESTHARTRT